MNRRQFIAATGAAVLVAPGAGVAEAPAMRTRWTVRGSEGFDALSFLGPLSGDPFYLEHYRDAVAAFSSRMPAPAMDALRALMAQARAAGDLLSPSLDVIFSAGPHDRIEDLIGALDRAETVLRPGYERSPYWDAGDWTGFVAARPQLREVLVAMRDAGFAAFRAAIFDPKAAQRLPALATSLGRHDVVAEVERLTGRRLDPVVEVVLLEFCKPHGIKVIGQRFLSAIDWPDSVVLRTAGHELLHPPVDMAGAAATAALAVLGRDPLLARIVAEHDPAFGYRTLDGLFDEDLASALDQLVAERLGTARDARERWNSVDDGMHILAAALYGLMKRSGHAATGGDVEAWLAGAVRSGWLAPNVLHGAAADVLGRPAGALWPLPRRG